MQAQGPMRMVLGWEVFGNRWPLEIYRRSFVWLACRSYGESIYNFSEGAPVSFPSPPRAHCRKLAIEFQFSDGVRRSEINVLLSELHSTRVMFHK